MERTERKTASLDELPRVYAISAGPVASTAVSYWRPRIKGRKNAFSLCVFRRDLELLKYRYKQQPEYKQRVSAAPESERMGVLRALVKEMGFFVPKGEKSARDLNKKRRGPKKEKK